MNNQGVRFPDAPLKSAHSSSKCLAGVTKPVSLQVQPSLFLTTATSVILMGGLKSVRIEVPALVLRKHVHTRVLIWFSSVYFILPIFTIETLQGFAIGYPISWASQVALVVKSHLPTQETWDVGSIPESGRSPGGGRENSLQYSCMENPL